MGIEEFLLDRAKREGIEQGIERGIEQGFERGIEQGKMNFLRSLITGTDFTDDRIAVLVGVSVELVRETRNSMTSS